VSINEGDGFSWVCAPFDKKTPEIPGRKYQKDIFIFFHPDFTVATGIAPVRAVRLAGYTAGREFHPALKTVIV
jgi:hypothetical protein